MYTHTHTHTYTQIFKAMDVMPPFRASAHILFPEGYTSSADIEKIKSHVAK